MQYEYHFNIDSVFDNFTAKLVSLLANHLQLFILINRP